jgi:Ser/Thr protein kinase RdoA (MazF antagonist)
VLTDATTADMERARVDEALHVNSVAPAVAELLGRRPRTLHVLDAKYRPSSRCTVLYEADGRLVVGRLDLADEGPGAPLRLAAVPDDPALPGLPTILDGAAMAEQLEAVCGLRVRRCRTALVRYRPDKRATVRLDLVTSDGRRTLFAKAYHDPAKAQRVHDAMAALRPALAGSGLAVAMPVAHLIELAVVIQSPLPGTALDARHVGDAARGVAELHASGVNVDRARPASRALDKVEDRARRIAAVVPATGEAMLTVADGLRASAGAIGARPAVLVHGDCKPPQFLVDGDGVGLLDFDHVGQADPAVDVGAFLAAWPHDAPEADTFLAAYSDHSGAADDLVAGARWHRALVLLTRAERAFARSWRSPRPGALLADAARTLDHAEMHP